MTTLTVPGKMTISIHRSENERIMIPAKRILEYPTEITGVFDGVQPPSSAIKPPYIMFTVGWNPEWAGYGFEDISRAHTEVAAHLAAMDDKWPTEKAHVRILPVVDTRFSFIVTPYWVAAQPGASYGTEEMIGRLASTLDADHPDVAAKLRDLAKPSDCDCDCDCDCGCCCCCCGPS